MDMHCFIFLNYYEFIANFLTLYGLPAEIAGMWWKISTRKQVLCSTVPTDYFSRTMWDRVPRKDSYSWSAFSDCRSFSCSFSSFRLFLPIGFFSLFPQKICRCGFWFFYNRGNHVLTGCLDLFLCSSFFGCHCISIIGCVLSIGRGIPIGCILPLRSSCKNHIPAAFRPVFLFCLACCLTDQDQNHKNYSN